MPLSDNEEMILTRLRHLGKGSVAQLASLTRRPSDGVRGTLRNLHSKGYVEKVERGVWKLSEKGLLYLRQEMH